MKKVFMKSLLGVPVAIFLYEIINILFSIFAFEGQYFRLDGVNGFDLNQVITVYIELAVFGHLMTFLTLYTSKLNYTEKNEIQKAKKDAKVSTIIYVSTLLIFILFALLNTDSYAIAIAFPIIIVVFGVANIIKSVVDENAIKKINQKIKDNQNKED